MLYIIKHETRLSVYKARRVKGIFRSEQLSEQLNDYFTFTVKKIQGNYGQYAASIPMF